MTIPAGRLHRPHHPDRGGLGGDKADIGRPSPADGSAPDAGAVNFEVYASQWVNERGLSPTTNDLYRRLLRLHVLPTFGPLDLDEITSPRVRTWRTERLTTTEAPTTVAKAYRLLKAIMQTAADDELIRRNPCRIRGAGKEVAPDGPSPRWSRWTLWRTRSACAGS
jgi:hypothetical protein